ncbi:WD40-repeat-containing domain protein [Cladorrhinum sp. PSN332]|nr:WD40-repeat-containing domain protein [Cladorrhinum sp. PSN332]
MADYRETAAKLQKEWRVHIPHKQLDFAPHVKTYALVNLLNKGLLYEAYERQYAERKAPHDVPATAEATPRGVFGPLKYQPDVPGASDEEGENEHEHGHQHDQEDDDDESEPDAEYDLEDDIEIENPRKRVVDQQHGHNHVLSHGSPAKRPRLSNGYENGADSATTPMEIDHHHIENRHAYPSPLEGEPAASPPPRTEGPSRGTQVDKVQDLTQDTVFLRLGADESTEASENPIVLISRWNPKDPSILATGGTDTLARIWTLLRGAAAPAPDADPLSGHVDTSSRYFTHLAQDLGPNAAVTSMAWSANGKLLALGIEVGNKARLGVWSADGTIISKFDDLDSPITNVCWSPNDDYLLSISPDVSKGVANTGTLIHISSVLNPSMVNSLSYQLDYSITKYPIDATWISETDFLLGGENFLAAFRCAEKEIQPGKVFETREDERFSFVKYDWRSNTVATATDSGFIDIWDEHGRRRTIRAHDGVITALEWQPVQKDQQDSERLLISCGHDGTILVWDVSNPENKPKHSIQLDAPLYVANAALSITPDGSHIAAATLDRVLVWKLGEHAVPKGIWLPLDGWQTPRTDVSSDDANPPTLEWDSEGKQLVYGFENRLAVINVR